MWGQFTLNISSLSPKRDWGPKRVTLTKDYVFASEICLNFSFFLCLMRPRIPEDKHETTVDRGPQNTCAKHEDLSLKHGVKVWVFARKRRVFGAENGLILTRRSHLFEGLRDAFYRHALYYVEPALSEENGEISRSFLRKRLIVLVTDRL